MINLTIKQITSHRYNELIYSTDSSINKNSATTLK